MLPQLQLATLFQRMIFKAMDTLAIIILAGGMGSRIGGDKANKTLSGQRLIDIAFKKAFSSHKTIAIQVADKSQIQAPPAQMVFDDKQIDGPLGGIIGALNWAKFNGFEHIITIPCDSPFFPDDLFSRLEASSKTNNTIAVASSGGTLHPVFACWPVNILDDLRNSALAGNLSLKWNAKNIGMSVVDWQMVPFDPFFNINTIEDMEIAAKVIRDHPHIM